MLKQLDHAWTTRDTLSEEEWAQEASEAKRMRDETNAIVALLHRRKSNGWTIHRAIGRTVRDATEATPKFVFPASAQHSAADMTRFRDVARRLGLAAEAIVDLPTELDGVWHTDWSNGWRMVSFTSAARIPGPAR